MRRFSQWEFYRHGVSHTEETNLRAQRRDENEPDIVDALEKTRLYEVERHYTPDRADLAVRRIGGSVWIFAEIKTAKGTLTDSQARWPYLQQHPDLVWRTPEDALKACQKYL